jgi:hypothetical protein
MILIKNVQQKENMMIATSADPGGGGDTDPEPETTGGDTTPTEINEPW